MTKVKEKKILREIIEDVEIKLYNIELNIEFLERQKLLNPSSPEIDKQLSLNRAMRTNEILYQEFIKEKYGQTKKDS